MKTILLALMALVISGCASAPPVPKQPDLSNRFQINQSVPAETPGAVLPGAE